MDLRSIIRQFLQRLSEKGVRYWVSALIVFILATAGTSYVYDSVDRLTNARSLIFQKLLEYGPREIEPRFTKIVLIEDDEYWKNDILAGRRPIRRDYLAQLVNKLASDDFNVRLIALDFEARTPDPQSTEIPVQFRKETRDLIDAIENAAKRGKKVVLGTSIWFDEDGFHQDMDVYQAAGLCRPTCNDSEHSETYKDNISCGYVSLPSDPLAVPRRLNEICIDSFALAVARALNPDLVQASLQREGSEVRYSDFISEDKFRDRNRLFSAKAVRLAALNKSALDGSAVIIGGHWSSFASGRGASVDLHWTPVGWTVGAVLQANFAEAILDSRVLRATPHWLLNGTEILFSVIAAVIFALIPNLSGKLLAILGIFALLFFVQWAVLHLFAIFFDAFVPVLGLGLHSIYERLIGGD